MVRNRKRSKADAAPPAAAAPVVVEPGRRPRAARVFLMVAGGLAAPCLALAAFFMTSGADKPARPSAAQSGPVTRTSAPGGTGSVAGHSAAPATTTTTTARGPIGTPSRDPFAPLVNSAPATPGK